MQKVHSFSKLKTDFFFQMLKKYKELKITVPNCLLSWDSSISRTFEEVGLYLSKLSGHYMHRQFNIKHFHVLLTQCICDICESENKQLLFPSTALTK